MAYALRQAKHRDAAEIEAVIRRSAVEGYRHIFPPEAPMPDLRTALSEWYKLLNRKFGVYDLTMIAVDQGAIIGVVVTGRDPADRRTAHLSHLYVDPARWGMGVGTALHTAALNHLRQGGVTHATLWTLEGNIRARLWYERHGWRPTGQRMPVYSQGNVYDLVYSRDL